MIENNKILIGKGENPVYLLPNMANRHGLIAGATGTGKTVTLKVLAEGFSDMGVPVFLADVKGDVSSMCLAGTGDEKIMSRLENAGLPKELYQAKDYPCRFWDVFGKGGIPVRAMTSDLGPMLLSRLLGLTDAQAGVLNIAFHVADDNGLELIDFKDLRAMLTLISENRAELTSTYGNVSAQSIGVIQRNLLNLEDQGAEIFFGEPALNIMDWLAQAPDGRGMVNILHCVQLVQNPLLYATFMLWMLSELYETLPEVGDLDKPKLVFFFDEAHMLFKDAPKAMIDKVTQVVRLVRSKGVGIYFITQNPSDIPSDILSQLNNRIQHALHAYTPADQKAVKAAASAFRPNPAFKTEDAITSMGTGVALVSMLDETGAPCVVEQATICPPSCSFTALSDAARAMLVTGDALYEKYKDAIDNVSAYEIITEQAEAAAAAKAEEEAAKQAEKEAIAAQKQAEKEAKEAEKAAAAEAKAAAAEAKAAAAAEKEAAKAEREREREIQAQYKAEGKDKYGRTKVQASVEKAAKSAARSTARSIGRSVGGQITRGILGTSNKTVNRVVQNMAGNLASDLVGNIFKR